VLARRATSNAPEESSALDEPAGPRQLWRFAAILLARNALADRARAMHSPVPVSTPLAAEESSVPKKEQRSSRLKLRGKVLAFNISPKGYIEGALVETSAGPAQVNFPKHHAESLSRSTRLGANIEIAVRREPDEGEHPVFVAQADEGEFIGNIVRLNYALHGEVNGYHLDDGTFAHVKPEGAKKYKLRVGDKVKAVGERRAGVDAAVLEVRSLEKLGVRREQRAGT
jgi:hypothetical protein